MLPGTLQSLIAVLVGFGLFVSNEAIAKDKQKLIQASGRVTILSYGSPSWNTDSKKINEAHVVIRDRITGKLVKIELEETEPDSSQFSGHFVVDMGKQIRPEIYVPPHNLRDNDVDNKKLYDLIQNNKIPRKPMIWKKNDRGQAVMDVYDTREQAEAALNAYNEQRKAATKVRAKHDPAQLSSDQAMAAASAAARKAELDALALQAANRTADRVRMEQIERQKAEEREAQMNAMSEKQKAERRQRAEVIAKEAVTLYDAGNFKEAEQKFKQAIEIDPENREYNYKYGVTLYRNERFDQALVALKIAKVAPAIELERDYFMGLVHYRLSELDNALAKFNLISKSGDTTLAPSATFYAGVVYFTKEEYDSAKTSFETVIDTSTDPHMDTQAEEYIDRIASAMAFKKMQENKFTFTGVAGAMYDSNVLLSPDNATSTATNSADLRLTTIFNLQYRPIFNQTNEFSPNFMINLTNSLKNTSAKADPFIYTLAAPYSYSTTIGHKGVKSTATPGYEILYMDPTDTGTKKIQLTSTYLGFDSSINMNSTWVSTYSFEFRKETSHDETAIGDEDSNANKFTLRTTQVLALAKKQALMPTVGYIRNAAKGKNKIFNRYDLGVIYAAPFKWETNWTTGLALYKMTYPTAAIPRTDTNYTLTVGLTKPIRDWITWGVTGSYTKNNSNISANEYTKYMILSTATFVTNF